MSYATNCNLLLDFTYKYLCNIHTMSENSSSENHPTKRSCIPIQGTTNGHENKGQSQHAPPL